MKNSSQRRHLVSCMFLSFTKKEENLEEDFVKRIRFGGLSHDCRTPTPGSTDQVHDRRPTASSLRHPSIYTSCHVGNIEWKHKNSSSRY